MRKKSRWFTLLSQRCAKVAGKPGTFAVAAGILVLWGVTGPLFGFSDTWQLVVNTGTTIITFLMVFLIQNTQNRDTEAMQIKLDELIKSSRTARNSLLDLEELEEDELDQIRSHYEELADKARGAIGKRSKTKTQ